MDNLDKQMINQFQGDIPIEDRPFKIMAAQLDATESEVMTQISFMLDDGLLTRFGPMFNIDKMGGIFSLCAMRVPENNFDEVADKVNALSEVAHNYERDHALNMWFVIAAKSEKALEKTIKRIEYITDLKVYNFPKQKEFYVNLKLDI